MRYEMDKDQKKEIRKVCSVIVAFIFVAILGQIFVSCSPRVLPPAESENSVRVEYRERVVRDTVNIEVPQIKEVNVTRDSSSHLENDYAYSDAAIVDGLLMHSLQTKPRKILVPVTIPVHDTTYVEVKSEREVVEVERNFSQWEAFQMILGRILGGLLLLWMGFTAYKVIVLYKK